MTSLSQFVHGKRTLYCKTQVSGIVLDETASPTVSDDSHRKYEILGLTRECKEDDVRCAYKRLALVMHPDKGGEKEAFQRLKLAFETLVDRDRRCAYDLECATLRCCDGQRSSASHGGEAVGAQAPEQAWQQALSKARLIFESVRSGEDIDLSFVTLSEMHALQRFFNGNELKKVKKSSENDQFETDCSEASFKEGFVSIFRRGDDSYEVSFTCSHPLFHVYSQRTFDLKEAIDWHVALVELKRMIEPTAGASLRPNIFKTAVHKVNVIAPTVQLHFRSAIYQPKTQERIFFPVSETPYLAQKHWSSVKALIGSVTKDRVSKLKKKALGEIKEEKAAWIALRNQVSI
jgi:hypothetical protein